MGFAREKQRTPYHSPSFLQMLIPIKEGANCRESQQWSDFSYLIPSPRGRGLGRGPKQSNPPDTPRSIRRKFVAWALPTKTGNPIPFAIISANVIRGKSPRYAVQNPRYFQTTFHIKRSSEISKPALLPFRIQVERTIRHDRQVLAVEVDISLFRIEVFEQLRINRFGHKLNRCAVGQRA